MEPERRTLERDGVRISMLVLAGSEPATVLLHGLAGSATELMPTARALGGRTSILVDQRGHGRSTRRPADLTRAAFVADVVAVIEAEASEPVDLVGQSMGAHTAMLVAAERPDLVRRLVLLEGDQGGGSQADHDALGAFLAAWEVPFASRAEAVVALGGGALARAWADDLEETADGLRPRFDADVMLEAIRHVAEPRWDAWRAVLAPTLLVHGEHGMFGEGDRVAFAAQGRDVTRVELAGASHDAHLDAHEAWVAALRALLEAP